MQMNYHQIYVRLCHLHIGLFASKNIRREREGDNECAYVCAYASLMIQIKGTLSNRSTLLTEIGIAKTCNDVNIRDSWLLYHCDDIKYRITLNPC